MPLSAPDYARAIVAASPNYWQGRQGYEPLYIVAHGTDGSCPGAIDWLTDPLAGASVHYVVARDGTVTQLVAEHDSAWGNGIPEPDSTFCGGANPNLFTISIEHERTLGNTTPLTPQQQAASTALVADIRTRWGHIPLIPHSAISPQSRAHCPGPGFPLEAIDQGAGKPPARAGVVRLDKPFPATPQRLPLVFYRDWSFARPAYTSGATKATTLLFDQWVRGVGVMDPTTKQVDHRWFHRFNPHGACGWCPGAWCLGNPEGSSP